MLRATQSQRKGHASGLPVQPLSWRCPWAGWCPQLYFQHQKGTSDSPNAADSVLLFRGTDPAVAVHSGPWTGWFTAWAGLGAGCWRPSPAELGAERRELQPPHRGREMLPLMMLQPGLHVLDVFPNLNDSLYLSRSPCNETSEHHPPYLYNNIHTRQKTLETWSNSPTWSKTYWCLPGILK